MVSGRVRQFRSRPEVSGTISTTDSVVAGIELNKKKTEWVPLHHWDITASYTNLHLTLKIQIREFAYGIREIPKTISNIAYTLCDFSNSISDMQKYSSNTIREIAKGISDIANVIRDVTNAITVMITNGIRLMICKSLEFDFFECCHRQLVSRLETGSQLEPHWWLIMSNDSNVNYFGKSYLDQYSRQCVIWKFQITNLKLLYLYFKTLKL